MSARPTPALVELLAHTVDAHLPGHPDHERVLLLCLDAVTFAREYAPTGIGSRARAAAELLLGLDSPHLRMDLRRELAVACELAAIGWVYDRRSAP